MTPASQYSTDPDERGSERSSSSPVRPWLRPVRRGRHPFRPHRRAARAARRDARRGAGPARRAGREDVLRTVEPQRRGLAHGRSRRWLCRGYHRDQGGQRLHPRLYGRGNADRISFVATEGAVALGDDFTAEAGDTVVPIDFTQADGDIQAAIQAALGADFTVAYAAGQLEITDATGGTVDITGLNARISVDGLQDDPALPVFLDSGTSEAFSGLVGGEDRPSRPGVPADRQPGAEAGSGLSGPLAGEHGAKRRHPAAGAARQPVRHRLQLRPGHRHRHPDGALRRVDRPVRPSGGVHPGCLRVGRAEPC